MKKQALYILPVCFTFLVNIYTFFLLLFFFLSLTIIVKRYPNILHSLGVKLQSLLKWHIWITYSDCTSITSLIFFSSPVENACRQKKSYHHDNLKFTVQCCVDLIKLNGLHGPSHNQKKLFTDHTIVCMRDWVVFLIKMFMIQLKTFTFCLHCSQ